MKPPVPPDSLPGLARLVIVSGGFRPIVGGAERQAERLAESFGRRGVDVEVLTRRTEASHATFEDLGAVRIHRLGAAAAGRLRVRRLERLTFVAQLIRALRRRPDVPVLVQNLLYPALATVLGGPSGPKVARVSSTGTTSDFAAWGSLGVDRIFQRGFDALAVLNEQSRTEAISRGYDPKRVHIIPNGVSVPSSRPPSFTGAKRTVFVGGLRPEKRLDLLLQAWKLSGEPGDLLVIGEGPERPRLEALARELGIAPRFLGHVDEPMALLEPGDLFVLTSDAEGMSNALLEAMTRSCACLATYVGGNVDCLSPGAPAPPPSGRVEGEYGWLVPCRDLPAIASALSTLMGNPQLRSALGTAARTRVERDYSIDRAAERYLALFHDLAQARTAGRSGR